MEGRARARVVLQEEVEGTDLVQDDRLLDDPWLVYLVELLNRVVFLQVKAEDCI